MPGENLLARLASEFSIDLEECLALIEPSKQSIGKNNVKRGRKKKLEGKPQQKVIELHKEKEEVVLSAIKNVSTLFKTVRKSNNLTLTKMQAQINSPASYLSSIENGNKIPGKRLVTKLAQTFNLPLDQCLQIAGFSIDMEKTTKKQEKAKKLETKSSNKQELVTGSEMSVVKEAVTEQAGLELKEIPSEEIKKEKKVSQSKQLDRKKEHTAIKAVNLADLNYSKVAKGEFELSGGKSFVADLNLLMANMESESSSYEFTFIVDVESNQTVKVKISQGIIAVESGKKKQWILQ